MKNVTIALPDDVVRAARHLAVDQGLSLSGLVAKLVSEHVDASLSYEAARERQQRLLRDGLNLGTHGEAWWKRDELHER